MEPGTWNESYNWTREQFDSGIKEMLVDRQRTSICIDVEHSDRKNMNDIMRWAREAGYKAEEINCDTIRVWKE